MNYEKIYNDLCKRAKDQLKVRRLNKKLELEYYEGHHIIPKSKGGEGYTRNWSHPNITPLTAREHFIAHKLLCMMYPEDKKLSDSLWLLMNAKSKGQERYYVVSSREYEALKNVKSNNMKGVGNPLFGLKGDSHPRFGMTGSLNGKYGKPGPCLGLTGSLHPSYGKLNGTNNGMYGRTGSLNPQFNKTGSLSPNSIPVYQYDMKTGDLIKKHASATEAQNATNVDRASIRRAIIGKQTHAGGFHWKY